MVSGVDWRKLQKPVEAVILIAVPFHEQRCCFRHKFGRCARWVRGPALNLWWTPAMLFWVRGWWTQAVQFSSFRLTWSCAQRTWEGCLISSLTPSYVARRRLQSRKGRALLGPRPQCPQSHSTDKRVVSCVHLRIVAAHEINAIFLSIKSNFDQSLWQFVTLTVQIIKKGSVSVNKFFQETRHNCSTVFSSRWCTIWEIESQSVSTRTVATNFFQQKRTFLGSRWISCHLTRLTYKTGVGHCLYLACCNSFESTNLRRLTTHRSARNEQKEREILVCGPAQLVARSTMGDAKEHTEVSKKNIFTPANLRVWKCSSEMADQSACSKRQQQWPVIIRGFAV